MKAKLIIALLLAGLMACDDDSSVSKQNELTDIAKNGTWKITYFFDSDTDETNNFTGYNFTFGASNVLYFSFKEANGNELINK